MLYLTKNFGVYVLRNLAGAAERKLICTKLSDDRRNRAPWPSRLTSLQNGISYWRGSTDWPPDFHNDYYEHDLTAVQTNGVFNQEWWDRFISDVFVL
jgi:hypothetical protein